MLRRLFLLLFLLLAPVAARAQNITPELVAEGQAPPGGEVELAIHMRPKPGWHGYWQNPGDAGLPMQVDWQLPPGFSVEELRYPVPTRLTIAGLMNYVYERDYAVLVRLKVPEGARGVIPLRASARWLACTDEICVPEQGVLALDLPVGRAIHARGQFDEWRRELPRPLTTPASFEISGDTLRVGIPLPGNVTVAEPYLFPAEDGVVDYAGEQSFARSGDILIAELPRKSQAPERFAGVLAIGDGRGLSFEAVPGEVPEGGRPLEGWDSAALVWAVLGALAGGLLLNLMPCVFPILALKGMHLARSGGEAAEVRKDALAYTGGAVLGTAALGLALLAIRAAGSAAGWAFQLQDPRSIVLLLLLTVAITLNLLGLFALPAIGGRARPTGSFGTGALAAFVATPCAGPFLGAALGAALLLPPEAAVLIFAALGVGLAVPMLAIAFIRPLRTRLPKPGPWMARLQRFLAIPMAATAAGCLWLLYRQSGQEGLVLGILLAALISALLAGFGYVQRRGLRAGWPMIGLTALLIAFALWQVPERSRVAPMAPAGAEPWTAARVAGYQVTGHPVFVYFTADWCLTCKANEAAAINREEVRRAFRENGVKVVVGDWTNGDPAITRFLDSRGRAGVPLYLWYEPRQRPEELPQILTPSMLTARARRER